jgi:8-oxo-dGTP pyrophosphatase MutT (NUDIX family)
MIPSSHAIASFGSTTRDDDIPLANDTRGIGMSSPWSLPAREVEKMDCLERGETLPLPRIVERCLDRLAEVGPPLPGSAFRRAFLQRRLARPSDEEAQALIDEVPLCLLNARQRQRVIALRQHGLHGSPADAPFFDPEARSEDLCLATLDMLNAARGGVGSVSTKALAKLARWETDVSSPSDADARARGGHALREVVRAPFQGALNLDKGQGLTDDAGREFSLPHRELVEELGLTGRSLFTVLGASRPVDLQAFRDSVSPLKLTHWELHPSGPEHWPSPRLIQDGAVQVHLRGYLADVTSFAFGLAREEGRLLQEVHFVGQIPNRLRLGLIEPPNGWILRHADSERGFLDEDAHLSMHRHATDPKSVFAYWGGGDLAALRDSLGTSDDGRCLMTFLETFQRKLTAANAPGAPALREEMVARGQRFLRMLAAQPELLPEVVFDLVDLGPCVDALGQALCDMELTMGTGGAGTANDAAGALLRLTSRSLSQLHVSITRGHMGEAIELGIGLQALLDLRLAQLTGKSFIRTALPFHAEVGDMKHRVVGREPTVDDWKDGARAAAEQILGDEVRADFPMLRELMQSKSGAAYRAVETLRLDASYRAANDEWEQRFLEAGERAGDDPSDLEAARRYEEIQEQMPRALEKLTFALMDEWLDPLRKAYPTSPSTVTTS